MVPICSTALLNQLGKNTIVYQQIGGVSVRKALDHLNKDETTSTLCEFRRGDPSADLARTWHYAKYKAGNVCNVLTKPDYSSPAIQSNPCILDRERL